MSHLDPAAAPAGPRRRLMRRGGDAPRRGADRGHRAVFALRGAGPDALVSLAAGLWLVAGVAATATWWLAGGGRYWPAWVWVTVGAAVAVAAALRAAWRVTPGPQRWAAAHAGLAVVTAGLLWQVWLMTGSGPWLGWSLLGLSVAFSVHALLAFADRLPPRRRESLLSARVDELVRTRRGVLDVQSEERRRIERDLHDGAQVRLVALSMLLGRAEDRLGGDATSADLVRRAREEASAAIAELRDLARGLAPPLLAERGLVAAVESLALRSPVSVSVSGEVARRPAPATEDAAYFVIAESLTNVLKHAPEGAAHVRLAVEGSRLVVEVRDDGPGGARPDGSGLTGLRHRVEALDGSLVVRAAAGGGTTVRAELPCGW